MKRAIAIVGSYREAGINMQAAREVLAGAEQAGAQTRLVYLPEVNIEFCTNCRACMQEPGDAPGFCVFKDDMAELLSDCIEADGIVLASPINMGGVTAILKRFVERLAPLGYWPWGKPGPTNRKGVKPKRAVIIASSAAPAFAWRLAGYTALPTLRYTAKLLNGQVVCTLKYGMVSMTPTPQLNDKQRSVAQACGRKALQ